MKLEGFIGPTYALAHKSASSQRLVNLYPEVYEDGPRKGNVARFVGTPGLRNLATLGDGPVRGAHYASTGQLFVVSGANVYEVFSDWSYTMRSGALASSSGLVTMASDGTRVVIGDGGATAFQCPLAAGSAVAAIADADEPGGHVAWQDGYFLHTVPSTGQFAISELNSLSYDALDVATAEGNPDNLAMVLSVGRMIWLFGTRSTEVWWNSGNADFPFERNQSAFIETGTVSAASCVRAGGAVGFPVWVSSDDRGRGTVWRAQGFQPVRISTHAIEDALADCSRLDECSAFAYQQGGHEFYVLSVPASDDDAGGTWGYDFSTGNWHERMYLASTGEEPHRASCATAAFGQVVVGDREDGRLYAFDLDHYSDDGDEIRRVRQSRHVDQNQKRIRFNSLELQCEVGVGVGETSARTYAFSRFGDDGDYFRVTPNGPFQFAVGQVVRDINTGASATITSIELDDDGAAAAWVFRVGSGYVDFDSTGTLSHLSLGPGADPVVLLSWSDDAGKTWSNEHEASLGAQGENKARAIWRRLGAARDRVFRFAMSDPVPVTWLGAELDAVQLDK